LSFDGVTGSVRVPSSSWLQPQDALTVSAWVRHTGSQGAFKYIVGKGALGCQTGSYGLYTGPDGGLSFYVTDGSGTSYTRSPDAGVGVWDGNWHYVAGSYDGAAVRLFVDGVEVTPATPRTRPVTYFAQTTSSDLLLGDYSSCAGLGFEGAIDEPKIWDRALSL